MVLATGLDKQVSLIDVETGIGCRHLVGELTART